MIQVKGPGCQKSRTFCIKKQGVMAFGERVPAYHKRNTSSVTLSEVRL